MKTLCVIMSVYKGDSLHFVKQAVDSILNQRFDQFDFFILQDGPINFELRNFLDALLYKGRIIFIKRKDNKGLAVSLNELLGLTLGKYEYYARMDADDISMPDRFEKQVSFLNENPDIDCVGTWAIEIDEDGNEYYRKEMPVTNEQCLELFKKRDCMIHPTVMFRHSYFKRAGLYAEDTYFGEDTMMWAKGFASGCKFSNIPEFLLKFRMDKKFFERRRGWKHAVSILRLRHRVNKMLHFGPKAELSAFLYFGAKMMPKPILDWIYRHFRN